MTATLINTPVLETARLILRAPDLRDFDPYAEFFASPRSAIFGGPYPRDRSFRFFAYHIGHWALRGYGSFAMEPKAGGPTLGLILCHQPEGYPEREIGWTLFSGDSEGRGYAAEGADAVLGHMFGTLGWTTAVSYIDPVNARSIALAERLGALPDPAATLPDEDPCIVYRHPHPGAAQ